jgi:UDP-N-acetylglucosamine 2-epimerase (non-hydrolysing)
VKMVEASPPALTGIDAKQLDGKRLVLVTGHRRESFGAGFESLCLGLKDVADQVPDALIVYPVHLNPNVQAPVRRILANHPRILLLEPQSYLPFVWLMQRSTLIITDSGGIQEEAPSLGKPVLVMRDTTERPEAVEAGAAKLVGTDRARISSDAVRLLTDKAAYAEMSAVRNPYGDGNAAQRIVEVLSQ